VKPNGSKLWKWNYIYNGKQKTMNFGIYPMVGLADARAKRDDARAQLGEGRDPVIVKKLRKRANLDAGRNTFELVARSIARRWDRSVRGVGDPNKGIDQEGPEQIVGHAAMAVEQVDVIQFARMLAVERGAELAGIRIFKGEHGHLGEAENLLDCAGDPHDARPAQHRRFQNTLS